MFSVPGTWYCSSFIHREALRAQLQIDRFRFVNYQKFVTKRVILRMEVQSGNNNFDGGSKQFLLGGIWSHGTWYLVTSSILHRVDINLSISIGPHDHHAATEVLLQMIQTTIDSIHKRT